MSENNKLKNVLYIKIHIVSGLYSFHVIHCSIYKWHIFFWIYNLCRKFGKYNKEEKEKPPVHR